ncbi:MAG: hypothetical protein AB1847_14030 [bacterium]
MKQDCEPVVKPTIEEIKEQFILWRNNRKCRGQVPEQLWEAAIRLAEEYSIGHICKVLGLNNRQLKRRIQAHSGSGYGEEGKSCHFVELAVSSPESDTVSEPESDTEYVMEMEDQKGGRLKVHLKGGGASVSLVEMAKAFWGRDT